MLLAESTTIQNTGRLDSANRIRGEDAWIGRKVQANFGNHGDFYGVVTAVDDDAQNPGHRLFHVDFEDGDEAWLGVDEVSSILLAPEETISESAPEPTAETVVRLRACMHKT